MGPVGGSAALLGGLEDNLLLAVVVRLVRDQAVRVTGELETRLGGVETWVASQGSGDRGGGAPRTFAGDQTAEKGSSSKKAATWTKSLENNCWES